MVDQPWPWCLTDRRWLRAPRTRRRRLCLCLGLFLCLSLVLAVVSADCRLSRDSLEMHTGEGGERIAFGGCWSWRRVLCVLQRLHGVARKSCPPFVVHADAVGISLVLCFFRCECRFRVCCLRVFYAGRLRRSTLRPAGWTVGQMPFGGA